MYGDSIDLTGERITEGQNDLNVVDGDGLNRKSPKNKLFKPQKKHTSSVNIHVDEDQIQALSEKKPRILNRSEKKKESVTPQLIKPNMTDKFNQIIRFGSNIDKEMDAV